MSTPFSFHNSKIPLRFRCSNLSFQATIINKYIKDKKCTTLILGPDEKLLVELKEALLTFDSINSKTSDGTHKELPIKCFPTFDHLPSGSIKPSLKTRHERISILTDLQYQTPQVILSTLEGTIQATLPKTLLQSLSFKLQSQTREQVLNHLAQAGYLKVDLVEDPGTYATRGNILDLYPPNQKHPLRLEFFGEDLESIRLFKPQNQKSFRLEQINKVHSWFISPAREVVINSLNFRRIREKIKERADEAAIPRKIRDPILDSISEAHYPELSDYWAPFAYQNTECLWNHLPENTSVIWINEYNCLQKTEKLTSKSTPERTLPERNIFTPQIFEIYPQLESIVAAMKQNTVLFFDHFEPNEPSPSALEPEISEPRIKGFLNLRREIQTSPKLLHEKVKMWIENGYFVTVIAQSESTLERIKFLLFNNLETPNRLWSGSLSFTIGSLPMGFIWEEEKIIYLTDKDIFGTKVRGLQDGSSQAKPTNALEDWKGIQTLSDLKPGDLVVHIEHGIGRYLGLTHIVLSQIENDFLVIQYASLDKLYVPVYHLNVIQKYHGGTSETHLDSLGGVEFAKTKIKVREAVKKLAIDLLKLYAHRSAKKGWRLPPRDTYFADFESRFSFEETPDQQKSITDVLEDLESGKVMDRIICGDVGFGKTEVALRAAFRVVCEGGQVAVLVPTTLLAFQHENTFKERFSEFPLSIESLSRFKSLKSQHEIVERLKNGKIDIVIGTHRLLSKDIEFNNLKLMVIDEEHRFGVEHKERLKTLKIDTHALTLTATPIPRTLNMALSGLRDISLINTPPLHRLPIRTFVSKYDPVVIRTAIENEVARGGQVFFLHNRIESIQKTALEIQSWLPKLVIGVAHGQMPKETLEAKMMDFYNHRIQVLICTSIIESGLDIPTANTIIINRADTLGLAQLYQIRGRVGRGQERAFAYLLVPNENNMTQTACQRLEIIQRFVELGSGFQIASHDLDIRGGGDLLGAQQSGHIAAVGFDLYTELLHEEIQNLKSTQSNSEKPMESRIKDPEIKVPFSVFLSEKYVPDLNQRLTIYQRLSSIRMESEVQEIEIELQDRFGPLPLETISLLWIIRIKILLREIRATSLTLGANKILLGIEFHSLIKNIPPGFQLTHENKILFEFTGKTLSDLYFQLKSVFKVLT